MWKAWQRVKIVGVERMNIHCIINFSKKRKKKGRKEKNTLLSGNLLPRVHYVSKVKHL